MSKSVVPAAAVARAKQLVQNKKLAKHQDDQQPVQDADKKDEAAIVAHQNGAQHLSMSDATLGGFSFSSALTDAASSAASLTAVSVQDEGGYSDGDSDGSGTILLIGAVALVGAGIAVLAGGGGGDSNEAPTITSGGTATVAENAAATTVIYTTVATDPDGDQLTYSLTGADAAAFNISSTGVVTLKNPADFEAKSTYNFNVVASDSELTATKAVVLTVTNVTGETPVFTSGTTASVAENSAITTVVYDAAVAGTGAVFSLTGADASAFNIDSATGVVTFKASPDFEAKSSYAIGVTATQDGGTATQNVAVTVTDVVEPGPVFDSGSAVSLAENVPTSTVVYDANVLGTNAVTFGLTGADAGDFNINTTTGVVTFKESPDFETQAAYNFGVTAQDVNGTTTQAVVVTITDVEPEATSVSLDIGSLQTAAPALDASTGAITYTDDGDDLTNVIIDNFDADDQIVVSDAVLGDYNFTAINGDLIITYSDNGGDPFNNIVLRDAVADNAVVFTYATAVTALGGAEFQDFMTFA